MRTKSAYRKKIPAAETPAPCVQIDDEPISPSETVRIDFTTHKAEDPI